MSITDFTNKIKGIEKFDSFTLLYLFIVVFVGISAFGLGRLSVGNVVKSAVFYPQSEGIIQTEPQIGKIVSQQGVPLNNDSTEKRYLASKNGKLYYSVGCSGAKRIAEKNIIWFSTTTEAELAGYKVSTSCNK